MANIFTLGTTWIYFGGSWANNETFGFMVSYYLRANFGLVGIPVSVTPQEASLNRVFVYPNVSSNNFTVSVELEKKDNVKISVIDITGKVIAITTKDDVKSEKFNFDLNKEFVSGLYFVKVETSDQSIVRKINLVR